MYENKGTGNSDEELKVHPLQKSVPIADTRIPKPDSRFQHEEAPPSYLHEIKWLV